MFGLLKEVIDSSGTCVLQTQRRLKQHVNCIFSSPPSTLWPHFVLFHHPTLLYHRQQRVPCCDNIVVCAEWDLKITHKYLFLCVRRALHKCGQLITLSDFLHWGSVDVDLVEMGTQMCPIKTSYRGRYKFRPPRRLSPKPEVLSAVLYEGHMLGQTAL